MKRQGLTTTIRELKRIIRELERDTREHWKEVTGGDSYLYNDMFTEEMVNRKFQLNIINKKGKSDTWEFER